MAVRPARYAKDAQRRTAGEPPRLNQRPWPEIETGRELRRLLAEDRTREQGAKTLRRLSGRGSG